MRADNGSQSTPTERPKMKFIPSLDYYSHTHRTHVSVSSASLGVAARPVPISPPLCSQEALTRPAAIPY